MGSRIVEKAIKKMAVPPLGNRIEWDSEIPGFGVRITAAGAVSFIIDYRVGGRQRRYTIGRHPELSVAAARVAAGQLRLRIREGHDPMEERDQRRVEPTVNDLAAEYLERHAIPNKRPSSVRDDRTRIKRIIGPKLGKLRLRSVGRLDIERLHASLRGTPYEANRVLSLLSKMFSVAIEWKWADENPTKGIQRFQEERGGRWLTTEEIQRFRVALDGYCDQNAANALRLLLLTGSRAGEVLKAAWDQFDLERGVWTKPSHSTKQKRTEHVPLSEQAIQLLKTMMPEILTGPLFPGASGGNRVSLRRPWLQACKASGLAVAEPVVGKRGPTVRHRPTVRIHDLRHSYASHLVSNGVSLQVVAKLLGHTHAATTERYAHVQDQALRSAANRFGEIVDAPRLVSEGA